MEVGKSDREVGLKRICQVVLSLKELLVRGGLQESFKYDWNLVRMSKLIS